MYGQLGIASYSCFYRAWNFFQPSISEQFKSRKFLLKWFSKRIEYLVFTIFTNRKKQVWKFNYSVRWLHNVYFFVNLAFTTKKQVTNKTILPPVTRYRLNRWRLLRFTGWSLCALNVERPIFNIALFQKFHPANGGLHAPTPNDNTTNYR